MRIKNVYYSSGFKKSLRKFTPKEQKLFKKRIEIFLRNPFNPQLNTHKLKPYWSFSISYHLRVLFEFIDEESVGFIDIGTHEIYR